MSKNKDIWNTKENADAYDAYARMFPMYTETSRDLVAISDIQPGMLVVDLAAGTGVTTQLILDQTAGTVRIIAVDQAEEMLKKAHEKFPTRNVRFLVAEAENLDKVINEPIDAVLCNSAFWQIKPKNVFKSVANILKQGGIFAFNLPDSFFRYTDFIWQPVKPLPYTVHNLAEWGREVGLILVKQSVQTYTKTLDEILAFNDIPVIKRNFETEDEKKDFVTRLHEKYTAGKSQQQWVYFVFKKK